MEPKKRRIHPYYCQSNGYTQQKPKKISENIKIEEIQGEVVKSSVHILKKLYRSLSNQPQVKINY